MTAMTRTYVLNLALREIGAGRVEDYTEDTPQAIIGRDCWDHGWLKALGRHEWQHALMTAECARIVGTPVARYLYRYQLPGDFVRFGQVSENTMFQPKLDEGQGYVMRGGFLETNATSVFVDYVSSDTPIGACPPWFIDVFVADYASVMCSPLKATTERERMEKLAEKRLNEGRSIDSSQRPRVVTRSSRWLAAARGGGSAFSGSGGVPVPESGGIDGGTP